MSRGWGGLLVPVAAAIWLGSCALPDPAATRREVRDQAAERLRDHTGVERLDLAVGEAIAAALDDGVLDADEAIRLAVANNPGLAAIFENLDIARAEIWQAVLPPNPVVNGELRFVEGGGEIVELGIAQNVLDILLIPKRRAVAEEQFERVKAEVTAAVVDLATETRVAYRRLQAASELVELFRMAIEALFLSYDAARRLREAGNIIEVEMLMERALYEETRVALADAQARVRQQRENLNALLGLWGEPAGAWKIAPRLPDARELDFDPAELEARALDGSLDLRAARQDFIALARRVGLRRLEATFEQGSFGAIAEQEASNKWNAGPMAAVSLPMFNWGQAAGAEARARVRRSWHEFTNLAIRVRRSVRAAWVASVTARNNARFYQDLLLPLRQRITGQFQRQFNAMQLGVFQLLQIRRQELAAGRRYIQTLRDHWVARIEMESILMGRLPEQRFGIRTPSPGPTDVMGGGGDAQGGHE